MDDFHLEAIGSNDRGPCACCGKPSRTIWGRARRNDLPFAAYFVHWTPGAEAHGAQFDFIIGAWGEGATANDRFAVALQYRRLLTGPAFMVVDAHDRPVAASELVGHILTRRKVFETGWSDQVFALADVILAQDTRIAEL